MPGPDQFLQPHGGARVILSTLSILASQASGGVSFIATRSKSTREVFRRILNYLDRVGVNRKINNVSNHSHKVYNLDILA